MELEILDILDCKDYEHERIVLQVTDNCNCWPFMLFKSQSGSNGTKSAFIFPNLEVQKGDMITIYSKKGKDYKIRLTNGYKNHCLFWGEDNSVWTDSRNAAMLVKIEEYNYKVF